MAVLDGLADAIVVSDAEGSLLHANPAARALGLERIEAPLLRADRATPYARDELPLVRALRGEALDDADACVRGPAGTITRLSVSARAWRDAEGRIRGAVASYRDVGRRRALEEELAKARLFLDSIVENIPDMIFVKEAEHLRFERFNRAGEQLLGIRRDDLIGKSDQDFFPPDQVEQFIRRDRETLERGRLVDVPEEPIDTAHGRRWLHTKKIPLKDAQGRPAYLLGISEDITARKSAEDALRRAHADLEQRVQERTAELVRANDDLKRHASRLALLNHIARAMAGRHDLYSVFHVVLRYLEEQLPVDAGLFYALADERDLGIAAVGPRTRETSPYVEGTTEPIAGSGLAPCVRGETVYEPDRGADARCGNRSRVGIPLVVEGEILGILVAHRRGPDAFTAEERAFLGNLAEHVALAANQARLHSELRTAYDELQRTQAQVIQQERLRALGQMASGIAHDFNNALGPVLGFTDLLLESPGDRRSPEKLVEYLRLIRMAARDGARVVSRMREFYRPRDEKDALETVDLNAVVEDSVSLTRPRWQHQAQAESAFVEVEVAKQPLPRVSGNASDLREALTNLILNGVDAMPAGGTLRIATRATGTHAVLEVRDTGSGMSEEVRRRCFEPFFTTKGQNGTGLGLAVVHGIVRRHGGTIDVESAPGDGTTFTLRFPVRALEDAPGTAGEPSQTGPGRRVLVVEDHAPMRELVRALLEHDGHSVELANDGREALALIAARRYDLVLTDRAMPEVSGDQIALAVKQRDPATPVVLLTGFGEFMNAAGERPPGVDVVLSKPVTLRALRDAVASVAAKR